MLYNIYISHFTGKYNIFGLTKQKVQKLVMAYLNGEKYVSISGSKYYINEPSDVKIFQHEKCENSTEDSIKYYLGNINYSKKSSGELYLPPSTLLKLGKDVTDGFLQDKEYGENIKIATKEAIIKETNAYVDKERINQLKALPNSSFDFTKLVKLCEELNENFAKQSYLTVGMIVRTIMNHVPPIFGLKNFEEIASNYAGPKEHKSFKKNMSHLSDSLKNIADSYLHLQIRKKEVLPTEIQVDFKQDLDVLLAEIVRIS